MAAITVFFLLAIAYYIFMAPFLWYNALVIAAYAVYSPVVSFSLLHLGYNGDVTFDSHCWLAVLEEAQIAFSKLLNA